MEALFQRLKDWEDRSAQLEETVQQQEAQIDSLVLEVEQVKGLVCHCGETKVVTFSASFIHFSLQQPWTSQSPRTSHPTTKS